MLFLVLPDSPLAWSRITLLTFYALISFFAKCKYNIWVGLMEKCYGMCFPTTKWSVRTDSKILAWGHEFLCVPKTLTIKNRHIKPTPSNLLGIDGPKYTVIWELTWHVQLGLGIVESWPDAHSWAWGFLFDKQSPRTLASDTVTLRPWLSEAKEKHFLILSKNRQKYSHYAIHKIPNNPVAHS